MKAATYHLYGPPEVVKLEMVHKPVPKENEVLIKVNTATVNRTDCGFRSAEYFIVRFFSGLLKPRNKVLGCEFREQLKLLEKMLKPIEQVTRCLVLMMQASVGMLNIC